MPNPLTIRNLRVSVDGKDILNGVDLEIEKGTVQAIMGPNGSGKSTLANTLMGHPKYKIESGEAMFKDKNILTLKPHERAQAGLFLAFQYPLEIPGVPFNRFLWGAATTNQRSTGRNLYKNPVEFGKTLEAGFKALNLDWSFATRHINVGFSGGEKKRAEIVQMLMLKPEIVILDEIDSGLDVDSVKTVAGAINSVRSSGLGIMIITHYPRILNYLKPDRVHIMAGGRIVRTGGADLADVIERDGYDNIVSGIN
ncbi:MAG TPA: Fe-S cluster assembly ATPase SufC [bacterium]